MTDSTTASYQAANPFGQSIQFEEIAEQFAFFDDWEDRYKFILELAKQLPSMPEAGKVPANIIHGCQSQVWISAHIQDGRLWLQLDSDAHIVRGLIAIVLSAVNGRTPKEVLAADMESLFAQLDLLRHLSATRGNGLRSMVQRIRQIARDQH